jgi:hypothetical protein
MIAMIHFATLVIATLVAAAAAMSLNWLLLRAAFVLMQPAAGLKGALRKPGLRQAGLCYRDSQPALTAESWSPLRLGASRETK